MRVVMNLLPSLGPRSGVGHYAAELYRGLAAQAGSDHVRAFPAGLLRRAVSTAHRMRPSAVPAHGGRSRRWAAGLKRRAFDAVRRAGRVCQAVAFRAACRREQFDLYLEPNFIPLPGDVPAVVTVHDLSVVLNPQWHPADRVAYHERYFRAALGRCAHVLAVSESVRRDVIRTFGLAPGRVSRVYNGVRPGLRPLPDADVLPRLKQLRLAPGYLLFVGTVEPRKNLLTLLQAYCQLPAALRERCPLVLAGGWGWGCGPVARYLHDEARHRGVTALSYVHEDDLPALYNGARALAYPSHYEGFGLPPVEMMACGGAVLASTAAALAETVGGRAHLIAPDDRDGWRAALARVIVDDDWRAELRAGAVEHAARYTWEHSAADTWRVLRHLQAGPQTAPRRAA